MKNFMLIIILSILAACETDDDLLVRQNEFTGCIDFLASNSTPGADFDDNSCNYTPTTCANCDYVVELNEQVIDNVDLDLPEGAVIGIRAGNRKSLLFRNFHGTSDKPYIIRNCDGLVNIADQSTGIKLYSLSHVRLSGTGSSDQYGIKISEAAPIGVDADNRATDFEIDHIEITNTQWVGIGARTKPNCDDETNRGFFVQKNTSIHHNYIHEVGGEGMYIGGSHWNSNYPTNNNCPNKVLLEPELEGVKVYNNIVKNTGNDGIQVGSAKDTYIYNNVVDNYGLRNIEYHSTGLQINPGTRGSIFSNFVKGGTGVGIFIQGFDIKAFNNLIVDCKTVGIRVGDRDPLPNHSYTIVNNTMYNIGQVALSMNSTESVNNVYYNNLLINVTEGEHNKLGSQIDMDISHNMVLSDIGEAKVLNPAEFNFTPAIGSPLIDAGIAIEDEEIFIDYMFNKRKVGEGIDVGAFEFQGN